MRRIEEKIQPTGGGGVYLCSVLVENGTGHAKIATSPKAPRNDRKRGASLRALAKQSRQTSLRHPEFISGSINESMWTLSRRRCPLGQSRAVREWMSEANKQAQSDKRLMSGRSMTEMLGVLALIAVLSIGAVLGLRYAMDKVKVNQILNDVSLGFAQLQTVETSGDVVLGFIPESGLSTTGFRDNDGYDYIQVAEVPKSVCEKLLSFKNAGVFKQIYGANQSGALAFCADKQTMIFANGYCLSEVFVGGNCCQSGVACDGVCCEAGNACQDNVCTPAAENDACDTNADCGGIGSDFFCAFDEAIDENAGNGKCAKVSRYASKTATVDNIVWRISLKAMNWWNAMNWCNAQKGYKPVTLMDLRCEDRNNDKICDDLVFCDKLLYSEFEQQGYVWTSNSSFLQGNSFFVRFRNSGVNSNRNSVEYWAFCRRW